MSVVGNMEHHLLAGIVGVDIKYLEKLKLENQIMRTALNIIACWREGKEVTPSFDEPGSANIARDALLKVDE